MTALDRVNVLLMHLHMLPASRCTHELLDAIDKRAGILTRSRHPTKFKGDGLSPKEYIGARLRRLERHINAQAIPPFFWLGADIESPTQWIDA